jgi:aldose 1-epimerase
MTRSARVTTWHRTAAVELVDADTRVVVVPELGMLVAAYVVDGFDHVARPGRAEAVRNGHTTAVPLLYPWANRLAKRTYRAAGTDVSLRGVALHTDTNGLPIHGTMLGRPEWEVTALGRGRLRARFDFAEHPDLLRSFPFPHEVRVTVSVGRRRLRVVTEVCAGPTVGVPVAFGWHPYWRVPGRRDTWRLSLPDVAHLRLDRRGIPTGRALPEPPRAETLAGRDLDDLFACAATREVTLAGTGRALAVEFDDGYPYLQVFAPTGRPFCAIEPMTAPTNALVSGAHPTLAPGATFAAGFTASVRDVGTGR